MILDFLFLNNFTLPLQEILWSKTWYWHFKCLILSVATQPKTATTAVTKWTAPFCTCPKDIAEQRLHHPWIHMDPSRYSWTYSSFPIRKSTSTRWNWPLTLSCLCPGSIQDFAFTIWKTVMRSMHWLWQKWSSCGFQK